MQQQIAVITLGVGDLARARSFYVEGFGWQPVFENDEIVFFQMNGLMLALWVRSALEADMRRPGPVQPGCFSLAHNVPREEDVQPAIDRLAAAGGSILRAADAPAYGGRRGYVADPDGHGWEIAWNPAWAIDARGMVTFGV